MTDEKPTEERGAAAPAGPEATDRPFQFSLRTLLVGIVLFGISLSILTRVGGVVGLGLIWGGLLIAAHVLGNVWGTRSRQALPRFNAGEPDYEQVVVPLHVETPPTLLRQVKGVGWRTIGACLLSALVGGSIGGGGLHGLYGGRLPIGAWLFGTASAAILGGIFGFLVTTFLGRSWAAIDQATRGDTPARKASNKSSQQSQQH